ncbi:MAG: MazG nucleotide pyrophosphohydrolase domain-containing protein [Candidatus Competibacteraceae bacterium]
MTLDELQQTVDDWIRAHGGYWDSFQILARLTEELGEVAAVLQRQHGLRPRKTDVDLGSEVGDLLFTLAAFANANGLSLSECMAKVMDKYNLRDSQAWKTKDSP